MQNLPCCKPLPHKANKANKASPKQAFRDHTSTRQISTADIKTAIKRIKPTTPGEDGNRIVLYRTLQSWINPIPAKLFTAMVALKTKLKKILEGIIIPIYKKGNTAQPYNFRPITLLNIEYRIFDSILKDRLRIPLQKIILDTQTVFLPDRRSAHNIWTQQMVLCILEAGVRQDCPASPYLIIGLQLHRLFESQTIGMQVTSPITMAPMSTAGQEIPTENCVHLAHADVSSENNFRTESSSKIKQAINSYVVPRYIRNMIREVARPMV